MFVSLQEEKDIEADGNSDDLVSDEELNLSEKDLPEALETKIGGRKRQEGDACAEDVSDEELGHYDNCLAAYGNRMR